jgi:hypothetical protein
MLTRLHRGKEESIPVTELAEKPLSEEHRRIMDELLKEHVLGRKLVSGLFNAAEIIEQVTLERSRI